MSACVAAGSFIAERRHWIHSRSALRREISGQQGDGPKQQWGGGVHQRIRGAYAIEERAHHSSDQQRCDEPIPIPGAASTRACRSTRRRISPRSAPSAMRMPISWMRSETEYAITP